MHGKIGKTGSMALKLDMNKAFDRGEWSCLEKIMTKIGFHSRWISMVMSCVTSVTYSIRINGVPQGCITPTRGLRQGDPLSPYLFLLCAESLSSLVHKSAEMGTLQGLQVSSEALTSPIFSSLMTVYCSVMLPLLIVMKYKDYLWSMKGQQVSK